MLIPKMRLLILMLALIGFVPDAASEGSENTDEIPVGAIFDDNRVGEKTFAAFKYAVAIQNEKDSNFILNTEDSTSVLSMKNNFIVTKTICGLMANGSFAFFATHTMATIDAMKSYSSTFQMPFITSEIAVNSSGQEFGYELYLSPYYIKAIADIIKHRNWKDISYIYDTDEGLERWRQLMDGFAQNVFSQETRIYQVKNVDDAYVTLQRLTSYHSDGMLFLLDLATNDCRDLLERLNFDIGAISHQYFVVGLGIDELIYLEKLKLNVVGLRLLNTDNSTVQSFLRNWSRLNRNIDKGNRYQISYEEALTVDAVGVISRALQRMINDKPNIFKQTLRAGRVSSNGSQVINCDAELVQTWQHGHDIMKAMKELKFDGLTGHIEFDEFGLRRDYKLDILETRRGRGFQEVGSWHSEKGLNIPPVAVTLPAKGINPIDNRTRIITSIVMEPYLFIDSDHLKGDLTYQGFCADLARLIANNVGFKYVISPVKDGLFGSKRDSAWNGMIGELIRHDADIAIAPLSITNERERAVDFSVPFMSTGIGIMMKKPVKEQIGAFSFLHPFSDEIWLCVVFGFFAVQVILFVVNRLCQFGSFVEEKAGTTKQISIINCLWISHRPVRSIQGRVVSNVWSLTIILLMSVYTNTLFTTFKTDRTNWMIESSDDLAQQTEVKYGVIQHGSTADFFRQSTVPVYERMWSFMNSVEPSPFVSSAEEGVDRVRRGKYAFIGDSNTIDYFNARAPCDTMKVGRTFNVKGYGIATPIGSDLRDRVNLAVMELVETGDIPRLFNKWWHDRSECPKGDESTRRRYTGRSLKLSKFAGLFYILTGCLVLGLVILIFERMCKSRIESRIRKKENPPPIEEQLDVLE